jgi:hypothetical protein
MGPAGVLSDGMPVVSISVPSDLFRALEDGKGGRSRSGLWAHLLKVGMNMEGHQCPRSKKSRWRDDHKCPTCDHAGMKINFKEEQTWPAGTTWTYDGSRWVSDKSSK